MIPSKFDNMQWLEPWIGIGPGVEAQRLKLELKKEVGQGHPLYKQHAIPLARRSDNDDVLFYLPDAVGKRLVVVHLTWSSQSQPQQPSQTYEQTEWPYPVFYSSVNQWVYKCMVRVHREFTGPSETYLETVEHCKGMYDGSERGWVLVKYGPDEFHDEEHYFPINILTHMHR